MLPRAYLTDKQLEIWKLRFKGLSKAEVGRQLGISRQAVYDAENIMLEKVEAALKHVAEASRIEIGQIDVSKGILLGINSETRKKVIITFSARNGIQTWHYEQPDCEACKWLESCRQRLLDEADERDIPVSHLERELPPCKLANQIFSQAVPGWNL